MNRPYSVILALFLYIASITLQLASGYIFISPGTEFIYYLWVIIGILPIAELLFRNKLKFLRFYPISIFIVSNVIIALLTFAYFPFFALEIVIVALSLWYINTTDTQRIYHYLYVIYGISMLFLSGLLRIVPSNVTNELLIFNSGDDIKPGGVPLFFQNGIVLSSPRYFILTVSFQYLIVIMILGILLLENARGIIKLANGSRGDGKIKSKSLSITSMSFSIFSCQCETTTSIIPAIASEILGIISVPIIFESLFLSIGTFIILHILSNHRDINFFQRQWEGIRVSSKQIFLLVVLIIISPLTITTGVYLGYLNNLLFYFGTNLGMFSVSTFVFLTIIQYTGIPRKFRYVTYAGLSILATVLMVVWYLPPVLTLTIEYGFIFSLMSITSVIAGLVIAFILSGINRIQRAAIFEYISGMFPIIFVIILYYSVITSSRIWIQFSLADQLEFALILLGVTLPFMWYATNYSIYGNYHFQSQ